MSTYMSYDKCLAPDTLEVSRPWKVIPRAHIRPSTIPMIIVGISGISITYPHFDESRQPYSGTSALATRS